MNQTERKILQNLSDYPTYGISTQDKREWNACISLRDKGIVPIKSIGVSRDTHRGFTKTWYEGIVTLLAGRIITVL